MIHSSKDKFCKSINWYLIWWIFKYADPTYYIKSTKHFYGPIVKKVLNTSKLIKT